MSGKSGKPSQLKSITFGKNPQTTADSVETNKKSNKQKESTSDSQTPFVNSEFTGSYTMKNVTPTTSSLVHPPTAGDIPDWAFLAIQSMLVSLKTVDEMTYFHCLRVGQTSQKLAQAAGLNEYQQRLAEFSGMLHDVGKMGIDKDILHKPSRLNESEYHAMMSHPVLSEKIIRPFENVELFKAILPAVRNHHEWMNGTGYPDRLEGEQIPFLSRVILIVDTLDAMSVNRSYRSGLPIDVIYKEIQKYSGEQFDENLVQVFLQSHKFWSKDLKDPEQLEKNLLRVA